MRTAVIVVGVLALAAPARADDASRRTDRRRLAHGIAIAGFGAVYATSEALKSRLVPDTCRWCDPPGFDRSTRDALVWDDPARANFLSNVTLYGAVPATTLGLLIASSWCEGSARRWFDDTAPVLEAALAGGVVDQIAKLAFGRARPFVRFAPPGRNPEPDDNLSFFSGHTTFTFSLAVSAGTVAHRRGYRLEPVIWVGGLALAATTGYLRIAADKHYLSDVIVGAVVGSAFGAIVPRVFHADVLGADVMVVPTGTGAAIAGTF